MFIRAGLMGCGEEVKLCTQGADCAQGKKKAHKSFHFNGSFTKAINLWWLDVSRHNYIAMLLTEYSFLKLPSREWNTIPLLENMKAF